MTGRFAISSTVENTTLSNSELLSKQTQEKSLVQEALHSAAYAGLQAPISGVAQIVDNVCNTKYQDKLTFIDAPAESQFMSSRWHAQQLGGAVGMVIPFIALHKGVGIATTRALGKLEAEVSTKALQRRVIGEAAATGALYEGLFHPVKEKDGDFLSARIKNATAGALTFGALTASATKIQEIAKAERGIAGRVLRSEVGSGMLASLPAGFVNAETQSILSGRGPASRGEIVESMYGFAFAGGALSAGKSIIGGTTAETSLRQRQQAESARAIADGAPTLGERAVSGLESTRQRLGQAVEHLSGPALQPAFAGIGPELLATQRAPGLPRETVVFNQRLQGGLNTGPDLLPPELASKLKNVAPGEAPSTEAVSPNRVEPVREQARTGEKPVADRTEVPADARMDQPPLKPAEGPDANGYFYFEDYNHPGVVYHGTEAHMKGLSREGGYPVKSKFQRPIVDEKMHYEGTSLPEYEWWDIRRLPKDHFWTLPDEMYYDRIGEAPVESFEQQLRRQSEGTPLASPVMQEVMTRAAWRRLHPHPDALVVFMDGTSPIHFEGIKGKQFTSTLFDCAKPDLLKVRLADHTVTGAIVFGPHSVRTADGIIKSMRVRSTYGVVPKQIGALDAFLEPHR